MKINLNSGDIILNMERGDWIVVALPNGREFSLSCTTPSTVALVTDLDVPQNFLVHSGFQQIHDFGGPPVEDGWCRFCGDKANTPPDCCEYAIRRWNRHNKNEK